MTNSEYACEECEGGGEVVCDCCDREMECEDCNGTGYDPEKIDVQAIQAADATLILEGGISFAWIVDGVEIGRTNGKRSVAYKDFARVLSNN